MKKIFAILMVALLAAFTVSCTSCHRESEEQLPGANAAYEVTGLDVEQTIALDNEYMAANHGKYRFLECCIDAENWIDESDTLNVKGIANIYTVVTMAPDSMSCTVMVYMIAHTADTTVYLSKEGLWVGDNPMNDHYPFKVTFAESYDNMMRSNCVKPHSRHCVIRKEVGEKDIEPIYIFGNQDVQVYVSTETGNVTTTNPAYNKDTTEMRFNTSISW